MKLSERMKHVPILDGEPYPESPEDCEYVPEVRSLEERCERAEASCERAVTALDASMIALRKADDLAAICQRVIADRDALLVALRQCGEALEAVNEQLGEAVHTGLRKGADGGGSAAAWRAINEMSSEAWSQAIRFAIDGLGIKRALANEHVKRAMEGR